MNKLHPQELADLLQKPIAMDEDGMFFAYDSIPKIGSGIWGFDVGEHGVLEITHAIAKPDDCPEWYKALWEPRIMPERGQLCMFSNYDDSLIIGAAHIGYFSEIDEECFIDSAGNPWSYCKPIDSVPSRIDLDAQRS